MRFKSSGGSRSDSAIPKLAMAALAFTTAVILAQYVLPFSSLLIAAALFCLPIIPGFLIRGNRGLGVSIISLAAALGLLWFWGHELLYVQAGEQYVDLCVTTEAQVLEFPRVYDNYTAVTIKPTSGDVKNLKTELYIYDNDIPALEPGDIISADLKFKSAVKRYDERTGRYTSKGKYLLAYLDGGIKKTGRWQLSFLYAQIGRAHV